MITLKAISSIASLEKLEKNGFSLFDFLVRIQKDALFATSNTENAGEDSKTHAIGKIGLVAGHAYAMLEAGTVTLGQT